jgi:hypothetical protein
VGQASQVLSIEKSLSVLSFIQLQSVILNFAMTHFQISASRFSERGQLFSREEVRALQVGPGGLVFSGDSRGTVKVWRWTGVQLAAGGG